MFHPADLPVTDQPLMFKNVKKGKSVKKHVSKIASSPTFGVPSWMKSNAFSRTMDEEREPETAGDLWTNALMGTFTRQLKIAGLGRSVDRYPDDAADDLFDSHGLPMCALHFDKMTSPVEGPLEVKWIDLHVEKNSVAHHTDRFDGVKRLKELPYLAVRRGQEFLVTVNFYRDFDPNTEQVKLIFELGDLPSESKGTRTKLDILHEDQATVTANGWTVTTMCPNGVCTGNQMNLGVTSPPDTVIGSWHLTVLTVRQAAMGKHLESICPVYGIYFLFNPWCKDDSVFMENAANRDEYILNDIGQIWKGSFHSKQSITWNYGQFEEGVLEACMLILDQSRLSVPLRSSPVYVARMISQIINCSNELGVILSNWTNSSASGTPPAVWTGSAPILREYVTFGKPVRFAQCWVLAGVMNTVMRCLGIPSRVVTNYSSAHDMDNTSTVNIHFNEAKGKVNRDYNADTAWTFHCWNDCWMSRPDLPKGYGGWQAVDCTPQDKTDALERVGPAPVQAIKEGNVGCSFNVGSFYTEINAEKCYWVLDDRKQAKLLNQEYDQVGLGLVTKDLGPIGKAPQDITEEYKDKKESPQHRRMTMNALLRSNSQTSSGKPSLTRFTGDMKLKLDFSESCTLIGHDFTVGIILANRSHEDRTIKLYQRINAALYCGGVGKSVQSDSESYKIAAGEQRTVKATVTTREYLDKILGQACFQISVFGQCQETGQMLAVTDSWCLPFPEISIKHEELAVNETSKVTFSFINPLPIFLTKCRFVAEGAGILLPKIIPCKDAAPNCWVSAVCEMKPWEGGQRTLVARFISEQIEDVQGFVTANVAEDPEFKKFSVSG